MSVQRDCRFVHVLDTDNWYLVLAVEEHGSIGESASTVDGPFASQDGADEFLSRTYSNPGSSSVSTVQSKSDPFWGEFIARARRPGR